MFKSQQIKFSKMPKSIDPLLSDLLSKESWTKNNYTSTNNKKDDSFKINSEDKDIIFPSGFVTVNGNKISKNMPEQDQSSKELYKSTTQTKVYG